MDFNRQSYGPHNSILSPKQFELTPPIKHAAYIKTAGRQRLPVKSHDWTESTTIYSLYLES
jgi:hypothetical protein